LLQDVELGVRALVVVKVVPVGGFVLPERVVQVAALRQVALQLTVALDFVARREEIVVAERVLDPELGISHFVL